MKRKIIIKNNEIVGDNPDEEKAIKKALKIVEKFFDKKLNFKIVFIDTRDEMNLIYSQVSKLPRKTEDWVVGGYFDKDVIYLFSESSYAKVSCHKQETFFSTLVHEMAHLFSNKILKFHLPMWLDEGLAGVVANQDNKKLEFKQDLTKVYGDKDWMKENPYLTSGKFVRFIIKSYGKEKLFSLLKKLDFYEKEDSFNKKFSKVFGKTFKDLFNEWTP